MAMTITELTGVGRLGQRISRDMYLRVINLSLNAENYVTDGLAVPHKMNVLKIANITGPISHLFTYDHAAGKILICTAVNTQVGSGVALTIANIRIEFIGTR